MALIRSTRYPGRWTAPSAGHPQGAFKNRTAPGALDGSYIEQDWANDWDAFFSSMLGAAGITPNNAVDAVGSSQYYTALGSIITAAITANRVLPRDYLSGFTLANNSGAPNTTIDVGPGSARDSTNTVDINLTSTFSGILQASGAWAAGSGANKLDAGAKAISTTYHKFVIRKTSDGTGDILYSLSATAPTMPSGYAGFRRIGRVATDASGNIRGFKDRGNGNFEWTTISVEANQTGIAPGTSLLSLSGMGGVAVSARMQVLLSGDASVLRVLGTDQTDSTTSIPQANWNGGLVANNDTTGTDGPNTCEFISAVDASGQVRLRYTVATGTLNYRILVIGWRETR